VIEPYLIGDALGVNEGNMRARNNQTHRLGECLNFCV
jgi:hypothetical protein